MEEKKYFFLKLIPSRPTFAQDMTDEERGIMMQHVAYWADLLNKGIAIVFGPVMDPKGTYGIGIIAVDVEDRVNVITSNDPAAKLNKYEVLLMARAIHKK
ncbi:MAG TPA: YciI family protein [Bacteroidia bacterium]|nr:YciI family protein [Bacteroidia bacterium]